jgi:splicing factor U2AF subunit
MSSSSHKHEKEKHNDDSNGGTAARTRPSSFDEIMLRRKLKKQAKENQEKISQDNVKSNDLAKVKSTKREEGSSTRNIKLDKDSRDKTLRKDVESNDLAKVKYRRRKDESPTRDIKLDKDSRDKILQKDVDSNDLAKIKYRKRKDESSTRDIKLDKDRRDEILQKDVESDDLAKVKYRKRRDESSARDIKVDKDSRDEILQKDVESDDLAKVKYRKRKDESSDIKVDKDSLDEILQKDVESDDLAKVKYRKRKDESSARDIKLDKDSRDKVLQKDVESNDLAKVYHRKRKGESSTRDTKLDKVSQGKISRYNVEFNNLENVESREVEEETSTKDVRLEKVRLKSVIERTRIDDSPKEDKSKNDEILDVKHEPKKIDTKEKCADRDDDSPKEDDRKNDEILDFKHEPEKINTKEKCADRDDDSPKEDKRKNDEILDFKHEPKKINTIGKCADRDYDSPKEDKRKNDDILDFKHEPKKTNTKEKHADRDDGSPKEDKRKNDEILDFKHEPKKINSKEKHVDRDQGRTEKETKRKNRYEDDDNSKERFEKETKRKSRYEDDDNSRYKKRERDSLKKKESKESHKYQEPVKKESSSSSHKRRRSRSRDRTNDDKKEKGRKSLNSKDSPSRLGGYSPRKRRTEAAIKTPSPPTIYRSPEKKTPTWDLPPVVKAVNTTNPTNSTNSALLPNLVIPEPVKVVPPILNTQIKQQLQPVVGILSAALQSTNVTVDSVQLTQATRPMRTLFVQNLPASVSEEDLKNCLNDFLVLPGVNIIRGTKPCISCIINKGQAVAEFLTPEDATKALSFDGRSFSGSVLKIRRPKDFVGVAAKTTGGDPEKSVAAPEDSVSNIVLDSPHKIFIGGVSKLISSNMFKEIASVFGRLKAYHFEVHEDCNKRCAYLEYADEAVTSNACAGLNGMKLGGQMLTVVLATPKASPLKENIKNPPSYEIPEHAKSLLEKPTRVLKLRNMLDPSNLSSLSEPEVEDILEDVRLECARFGTVKSVNIIKSSDSSIQEQIIDKKENESEITNLNLDGKLKIKSEPSAENKPLVKEETITESKHGNSVVNHHLEAGCILVEYRRVEASSAAAHCFHDRIFDGRIVTVEYVDHDFYKLRFPK